MKLVNSLIFLTILACSGEFYSQILVLSISLILNSEAQKDTKVKDAAVPFPTKPDDCDSIVNFLEIVNNILKPLLQSVMIEYFSTQQRLNFVKPYTLASEEEQRETLEEDLQIITNITIAADFLPFPIENFRLSGLENINKTKSDEISEITLFTNIDYFVRRAFNFSREFSKIANDKITKLAGISPESFDGFINNDPKQRSILSPLIKCIEPYLREIKRRISLLLDELFNLGNEIKLGLD